ncbi:sugar phosphate isomerase/epimerase [Dyadobacter jejuensis]|uniref:Sugar phosphate isomerase/epimerase n=1 Tax=Dyadobacter jejuensis TaxID=1082580 RepID=A0A316AMW7_9BACT|nr:TIM barrel protein [Dyadobacter jejuensis]PWJ58841.1 sugar phosphate isomerase/epimerase [Dyadobacter jejuensis]
MNQRRNFVKKSLAGLALASFGGAKLQSAPIAGKKQKDSFKLAIAGYTFVKFKLDEALAMMQKTDVNYLCIKDFHLPMDSTDAEIAAFHQKLKAANVQGYGVGPIYAKTKESVDKAFDYAKRVGVDLIVGVPNMELLPYVESKVKAFNIRYAIHNHGPDIDLFPNAASIYKEIKDMDARMGICFDMGHNVRDKQDSIADMGRYHKRIFDIHLKNVTAAEKAGKTCELSRGIIDIPAFVAMLRKVKYSGTCSLEYEKDMHDPLAGIAESVGYFRGVVDAS